LLGPLRLIFLVPLEGRSVGTARRSLVLVFTAWLLASDGEVSSVTYPPEVLSKASIVGFVADTCSASCCGSEVRRVVRGLVAASRTSVLSNAARLEGAGGNGMC
jgi:hypothetical protein